MVGETASIWLFGFRWLFRWPPSLKPPLSFCGFFHAGEAHRRPPLFCTSDVLCPNRGFASVPGQLDDIQSTGCSVLVAWPVFPSHLDCRPGVFGRQYLMCSAQIETIENICLGQARQVEMFRTYSLGNSVSLLMVHLLASASRFCFSRRFHTLGGRSLSLRLLAAADAHDSSEREEAAVRAWNALFLRLGVPPEVPSEIDPALHSCMKVALMSILVKPLASSHGMRTDCGLEWPPVGSMHEERLEY